MCELTRSSVVCAFLRVGPQLRVPAGIFCSDAGPEFNSPGSLSEDSTLN